MEFILIMLGAIMIGLVAGILPGIGGPVTLALLIPITFNMNLEQSIVLLLSAYGVVTYGGAITSILVNTPGDALNAATTFDGYPLAKQGKAGMAITVAVLCSTLGGIFGLLVLGFFIPIARALVLTFSYPEFFTLSLLGLALIAVITRGNMYRGIISGLLGLLLSFIGMEPIMGTPRFAFGTNYLWQGIPLMPVLIGLFAITEAFNLYAQKDAVSTNIKMKGSGFLEGVATLLKRPWLFIRSSLIGVGVGIVPGVGGVLASFLAYGVAAKTSKNKELFGKGNIEGVIASESANDAKEGGAMIPTFAFGIPGSVGMAIFMGGLMMHGLTPGPEMLTTKLDMTHFIIAVGVVSKIIALPIAILIGVRLVFVTKIRGELMAPGIIALSLVGAYAESGNFIDVIVAVIFGIIGFLMKKYSYSSTPLIIAIVLGAIIESTFHQTLATFGGAGFFTRPIALAFLLISVSFVFWPLIKRLYNRMAGRGVN